MPLADGQVIDGYTILRSLGAGGMGEVYLAQHPRLPRARRAQGAVGVGVRRERVPATVQARGRHRGHVVAPAHRRGARPRRRRRPAVDLDGLRRGHRRGPAAYRALSGRDATRQGRSYRHCGRRRARLRAPARAAAPRRQARQHPAGQRRHRRRADHVGRLRHCPLGRRAEHAHRDEHDRGDGCIRRTRAAQGRRRRRSRRPVRARGNGLPIADRHAAVPTLQPRGRHQQAPHRRSTPYRHPSPRIVGSRPDFRQGAGQVTERALRPMH